jgi:hypothetical protein
LVARHSSDALALRGWRLLLALVDELGDIDGRDDGLSPSDGDRAEGTLADQFPAQGGFDAQVLKGLVDWVDRVREAKLAGEGGEIGVC